MIINVQFFNILITDKLLCNIGSENLEVLCYFIYVLLLVVGLDVLEYRFSSFLLP
jgi:hypothetical protein